MSEVSVSVEITCSNPKCPNPEDIDSPADRNDLDYPVTCRSCGKRLGSWGEILEAAKAKTEQDLKDAIEKGLAIGIERVRRTSD
jgi:DNA-directed RNA polymerase subunit N (RpoN/RPB10)